MLTKLLSDTDSKQGELVVWPGGLTTSCVSGMSHLILQFLQGSLHACHRRSLHTHTPERTVSCIIRKSKTNVDHGGVQCSSSSAWFACIDNINVICCTAHVMPYEARAINTPPYNQLRFLLLNTPAPPLSTLTKQACCRFLPVRKRARLW